MQLTDQGINQNCAILRFLETYYTKIDFKHDFAEFLRQKKMQLDMHGDLTDFSFNSDTLNIDVGEYSLNIEIKPNMEGNQ